VDRLRRFFTEPTTWIQPHGLRSFRAFNVALVAAMGVHAIAHENTVNLAARMESHGVPGAVQVSRTTRDLLGDTFALEARGVVQVKGKGPTETWLLVGRAPEAPAQC
jgi:class 3 adenylate cyclase